MDDMAKMLGEALGVDCIALPADGTGASLRQKLSILVYAAFDFYCVELLSERILIARPREDLVPVRLIRFLDEVDAASPYPVVCSLRSVTPYLRAILFREHKGFVTDDGQAYVPGFLRLVPKRRLRPAQAPDPWGPAERQAFIYLLGHIGEEVTATGLREVTGMSATSATRALAKVAASTPVERSVGGPTGRTNVWRVADVESFVERGMASFGDAVRRHLFVEATAAAGLPLAGLSALADQSMLVPPRMEQRACGARQARGLRLVGPYDVGVPASEVLVLSYDPAPFVRDGMVDPFTMIVTIPEEMREDERVHMAIEDAVGGYAWHGR